MNPPTEENETNSSAAQTFISEGHILIANLPIGFVSLQRILLFPFMEVTIEDYYGEAFSPALSPWIRSYKAKLYTEIPNTLLREQVTDIHNRRQSELLIRPMLEIYLLAFAIFYEEPILFSFENTFPQSSAELLPQDITPLSINTVPTELQQLSVDQDYIVNGIVAPRVQLNRGLRAGEDLGLQRFTLVKTTGSGTLMNSLHAQEFNFAVFANIQGIVDRIETNRNNSAVIKALEFLRRAVVQEKSGFYNEAYLNYFRIIEAFANAYKETQLIPYFQQTFPLSEEEARSLCRTRNRVVSHGNQTPGYLREVGQMEMYKIKECAFAILEVHLI